MKKMRAIVLSVFSAAMLMVVVAMVVFAVLSRTNWATGDPAEYMAAFNELAAEGQSGEGSNGWDLLVEIAELQQRADAELARAMGDLVGGSVSGYWDLRNCNELERSDEVRQVVWSQLDLLDAMGFFELTAELDTYSAFYTKLSSVGPPLTRADVIIDLGKPLRNTIRVQVARFIRAMEEHDEATALAACRESLAIARSFASQPVIISRLQAESVIAYIGPEIRRSIADGFMTIRMRRALLDMTNDDGAFPSYARAFEGERLLVLASFRDVAGFTLRPRKARKTIDALFEESIRLAELPRRERQSLVAALSVRIEKAGKKSLAVAILMPSISGPLNYADFGFTELSGIRLMLALEIYRDEQGAYPETLEALTPGILDAIPDDPFAADGRFMYRLIDPASDDHGRGYLLYSVGADGVDDGGVVDEESPSRALSRKANAGTDYVFNVVRE